MTPAHHEHIAGFNNEKLLHNIESAVFSPVPRETRPRHTSRPLPRRRRMSDVLRDVLLSHDYVTVDQPLFSAVELFQSTVNRVPHMHPFALEAMRAAQRSADLTVKRAVWLILLLILPEMQSYVISVGDPEKTPRLLGWLSSEAERLFDGTYQKRYGDETLNAFVANACNAYDGVDVTGE